MNDLQFVPFDERYLSEAESWFDHGLSLQTLGRGLRDYSQWSGSSVPQGHSQHRWLITQNDEPIAFVDIRINHRHDAYLTFAVKPSARRQGIGKEVVSQLLARPELNGAHHVIAFSEPANTAGQKLLIDQGFRRGELSPEGFIEFTRRV